MPFLQTLRKKLIGKSLDPLHPQTHHNLALAAFLAWMGLGAGVEF